MCLLEQTLGSGTAARCPSGLEHGAWGYLSGLRTPDSGLRYAPILILEMRRRAAQGPTQHMEAAVRL